ncbi:hypothetical protein ACHHV8_34770 [Paenibacillus sp. TAB 01]|uniref:hypothetical protein n=1 Tax=Paenibacillus sp. TAB 01 TaxID=3368988 RepID=UPI003750974E
MNEKALYQGADPAQMEWSPDGKKLLINGWKPYESRPMPSVLSPSERSPLIIELKSG